MGAKNQRVRALNPFYKGKQKIGIGSVIDLPMAEALELRSCNKVEFVPSDTNTEVTDKLRPRTDAAGPSETSEGIEDTTTERAPAGKEPAKGKK